MTGQNAQHTIYLAHSSDGINWSNFYQLGNNTSVPQAAPALAVFNNKLYITWTGGFNDVNIASSTDGITFSNQSIIFSGQYAALGSTSLAAVSGTLYIAYSALNQPFCCITNAVLTSHSTDGVHWATPTPHAYGSYGSQWSPGIGSFNNTGVTLVFTTVPQPEFPTRHLLAEALVGPALSNTFIPTNSAPVVPNNSGPGVGSLGNNLYVIWPGTSASQQVWITTYKFSGSGFTFLTQFATGQLCIGNPAIFGFNGHVYYAWTGTDSNHHVNIAIYQ